MNNENIKKIKEMNLAAPCGMYCGACRHYLVLKKDLLKKKGFKRGCVGCRIRNKKCVHIKKDCAKIRNNQIDFCIDCGDFPCNNLNKIENRYKQKYDVSLIENLRKLKEIGVNEWLEEQDKRWKCPECGGNICIHDQECFDCGLKMV